MNPIPEAKLAIEADLKLLLAAGLDRIARVHATSRIRANVDALAAASAGGGHVKNCDCHNVREGNVDPRCHQPRPDADEAEQLRVQLAGVSVAALGGTSEAVRVQKGQYGWSMAYQDTLELRLKYEELLKPRPELPSRCPHCGKDLQ